MRFLAFVGLLALAVPATAQTPPVPPSPKPVQAAPAPATAAGGIPQVPPAAKTAPPRAAVAASNAKTTIVIEVTSPRGLGIQDIRVELAGPVPRDGTTDASGFVRFLGLRPGTYRARFSGKDFVTLEKEIAVAAGRTTETEATLNPAWDDVKATLPKPGEKVAPAATPKGKGKGKKKAE
ncbi:MAG: carboxypeptidase-like regulatory domain-containing protein [Vicinamibacterales bacterium]